MVAGYRWYSVNLLCGHLAFWNSQSHPTACRMKILARCEVVVAILLTVALVVLHVVFWFHAGPLWRDEISSLALATKPTFSGFWQSLKFDPFPAIYFLVLRIWNAAGFGHNDLG